MIDEEKFDKYLWELKSDPLFGKPIADTLLRKKSQLRKEVILMLEHAQKGEFRKNEKDIEKYFHEKLGIQFNPDDEIFFKKIVELKK